MKYRTHPRRPVRQAFRTRPSKTPQKHRTIHQQAGGADGRTLAGSWWRQFENIGNFGVCIVFDTRSSILKVLAALHGPHTTVRATPFYILDDVSWAVHGPVGHVSGPGEAAGTTQECPRSLWTIFKISKIFIFWIGIFMVLVAK